MFNEGTLFHLLAGPRAREGFIIIVIIIIISLVLQTLR